MAASTSTPPFSEHYGKLFDEREEGQQHRPKQDHQPIREYELPLLDLCGLRGSSEERRSCAEAIAEASSEWGFFQVLSHGICPQLLAEMRREQIELFEMPFENKASSGLLGGSYRWGTASATSLEQFSWSEAFHVPLAKISELDCSFGESKSLREVMEKLGRALSEFAHVPATVLAENLGYKGSIFPEGCNRSTCFLRLNRYPACPFLPEKTFGLTPHTDSDFITILYQDQVGGLQLMKDGKWVAVKPNPDALIVNIGDLFQAWSNSIYKSVEHKVMANGMSDRYSIAYFMCPSHETTIGSCREPSLYKKFTFGEFRRQVQEDVKTTGQKVGLSRFLS